MPHNQVAGNIVNGQALAAQIIISEFAMELNQGHIDEINFDGSMKIRNGPTIRINDPQRRVFGWLLVPIHGGRRPEP
jgi:hypothetical protein